jgi:radical SAM protein with 4Fe4S-binding SPASM domain
MALNSVTWVIWHITQSCNLMCDYCFTDSSPHSPAPMSADALRHTVRAVNESQAGLVTIIGGEPFTVRELPEYVEALLDFSDRKVNIDTNGLFLKTRWSDVYTKVNRINVSLDGATNITVTPQNYDRLVETGRFALVLGASVIGFSRAKPIGRGAHYVHQNPLSLDEERVAVTGISDFVEQHGDECTVQANGFYAPELFEAGAASRLPPCMCGHGKLTINHDGDIYPCEVMPFLRERTEWERRFGTVPNILTGSLESALDSPLFANWRRLTGAQPPECWGCRYRLYCDTGCRALAMLHSQQLRKDQTCRL